MHANCLRYLFVGALGLQSVSFIGVDLTPGKATNLRITVEMLFLN